MSGQDIDIRRHTLSNGLRVVHHYDPATAMVAVDVLYNVGARDESRALTGLAHLTEHLMFGGSVHVPSFDGVLEAAGGRSNAWTSNDFTNFYDVLPACNVATAFYLESDRMLGLDLSEHSLAVQRGVVIEEFKQVCLNRPYGDLWHHLRRLAYGAAHPYSWPTIGLEPDHIARVTMADVDRWLYRHYAPNNAVLSVSGHVDFDTVTALAEEWFGSIERRDIAPRVLADEGFPTADVVETVYGTVPQPMIVMAFPMDSYGTERYQAADTVTDLLSAGRASRFTRHLMRGSHGSLFAGADASIMGSEHAGLLLLTARVTENSDAAIDKACGLLLQQARRIAEPGEVTEREFERTVNNFEASHRFSNIGFLSCATNMAEAEIRGEDINAVVDARRSLRLAAVTDEAHRLFYDTPFVTLVYRPIDISTKTG